ncbi:MAG: hypothetical protein AAGB34_08485 [Planctomycetota bacterium]
MIDRLSAITIRRKESATRLPGSEALDTVLARASLLRSPVLVVSTCERFEVYTAGSLSARELFPSAERGCDRCAFDTAHHLFRVASGLDSRLPGESHVLGQVRRAASLAETLRLLSSDLRTLVDRALRAGRKARTITGLSDIATSYAALAAKSVVGCSNIVIVGTGSLSADIAREISPDASLTIVGRHADRTESLARTISTATRFATLDSLSEAITGSDAVITATGSSRILVTHDHAMRMAPGRVLVDVSAISNIDPSIPGVIDLDTLSYNGDIGLHPAVTAAEHIVERELDAFKRRVVARYPLVGGAG